MIRNEPKRIEGTGWRESDLARVTVHRPEGRDAAIWRVSPPHNVAELHGLVTAKSFAATLWGGGHLLARERLHARHDGRGTICRSVRQIPPIDAGSFLRGSEIGRQPKDCKRSGTREIECRRASTVAAAAPQSAASVCRLLPCCFQHRRQTLRLRNPARRVTARVTLNSKRTDYR